MVFVKATLDDGWCLCNDAGGGRDTEGGDAK
jgi:hypothetical protein